MADLGQYDPNDPNNPYKLGNILGGIGSKVLTAGNGSDAFATNPLTTFGTPDASPVTGGGTFIPGGITTPQSVPNALGAGGLPKPIDNNAPNTTIPASAIGGPPPSTDTMFTAPPTLALGRNFDHGAIWNPKTGEILASTLGTPTDQSGGVGSAFQQNYNYPQTTQPAFQQGIRTPQVQTPDPIAQSSLYSPGDTTDTSFGGMFAQGLRMKQDRAYAGMNDAVTKNMLAGRGQDITAQGQALTGANEAERNRLTGIRNAAVQPLEAAQTAAVNVETAQKLQAAELFDKMSAIDPAKDPALYKKYADQIAMLNKHFGAPTSPHIGTVADSLGQQHVYAAQTNPATGGIQMTTENDMLSPQQKLQAATAKMSQKQLEKYSAAIKPIDPNDPNAYVKALAIAQDQQRPAK